MVAGVVSIIVGSNMNNSIASQLESIFSGGGANPGTPWIVIGVVVGVVGLVLLIAGLVKKNNNKNG